MNKRRFNTEEEVLVLDEVVQDVLNGVMSYRKGAAHLTAVTGKRFSHEGLRKIVKKTLEVTDDGSRSEALGA